MRIKIQELCLEEITSFCKSIAQTLLILKGKEKFVKIFEYYDENINDFYLISDSFRIKQILLNFLSNSVKFTKSGRIEINSCIIENHSKVKISIIPEDLKHIFKDKFMGESNKIWNQSGSGLGLSISKVIAEKLNIIIEFNSKFNEGTEFSIIIPIDGKKQKNKINYNLNTESNLKNSNLYNSKLDKEIILYSNITPFDPVKLKKNEEFKFIFYCAIY